jgi:hypothetical protein
MAEPDGEIAATAPVLNIGRSGPKISPKEWQF